MKLTFTPPPIPKSISAVYEWGNSEVDYPEDVYFGETSLGGIRSIARPWTDVAIARNNLPHLLAANTRKVGDIQQAFMQLVSHLKSEFNDVLDNYEWGIESRNEKQYRSGLTWQKITDSGKLRDSLVITIDVVPH